MWVRSVSGLNRPGSPRWLIGAVLTAGGAFGVILGSRATAGRAILIPLGAVCVTVLVLTAGVQGGLPIGSVGAFVNTDYGRVAAGKLVLFLVLLAIAARNCFWLTPGLVGPAGERSRTGLRRAIIGETVVGGAVIILAGVLTELPPAMNMGGMPH